MSFCSVGVQHVMALKAGWWLVYPSGNSLGLVCVAGVNMAMVVGLPQSLTTILTTFLNCCSVVCMLVRVSARLSVSRGRVLVRPPLAKNNAQSSIQVMPGLSCPAGVANIVFRNAQISAYKLLLLKLVGVVFGSVVRSSRVASRVAG